MTSTKRSPRPAGEKPRSIATCGKSAIATRNPSRNGFPDIPRRVSGYNLDELLPDKSFNVARSLVGTEGTCVVVLRARLRLIPSPPIRTLVAVGYRDVFAAADDVPEVLKYGPIGLEGLDEGLISDMRVKNLHTDDVELLPQGQGWLLAEFGGETIDEAEAAAKKLVEALEKRDQPPTTKIFDSRRSEEHVWEVRESGLAATAHVPGKASTWPGWEDAAVDPARLGDYLRDFRELLDRYEYQGDLYGHFGQGCIHTRITFDLVSATGIGRYRQFLVEAANLVLSYGGSLSGEHGDGQARAELLPLMYGNELVQAFADFKSAWDPDWKMNPGKVVHPNAIDQNLRLGSDYRPWQPDTAFAYVSDEGNFPEVALRCVGVGECRRQDGGVMCPSYMVTREEKHSTRGRARMLFEMMEGEVVTDGWRSDEVRESLDLCLACKGCKSDCPINVDMATYKAEFLSHYYARRLRPRAAYSMGLIYWWARLVSRFPRLVNYVSSSAPLSAIAKRLGGIAPERDIPHFPDEPFTAWYARRGSRNPDGRRVLLWPDTFTNYLQPDVAKAAVRVLEAAGFNVDIPGRALCCGRPLYDFGMVGTGKRLWRQTLEYLQDDIRAGTPLIGLEPSCVAAFRDELGNLFPHDQDATRLAGQTLMLSEFLVDWAPDFEVPKLSRKALVQVHCHHHSVIGFDADRQVMDRLGLDYEIPDAGCCGMAGSFGFEAGEKYDVSIAAGERVLLPKVRAASPDTLIIADGFSCREQISQTTRRKARHLAEVLAMALAESGNSIPRSHAPQSVQTSRRAAATVGAAALGLGAIATADWH